MSKSVVEAHPYLYHYTTAAGLKGIIESQQLWATNIAYLNDAEEHTGFFDRRLPHILGAPVRTAVAEIEKTSEGKKAINDLGGLIKAVDEWLEVLVSVSRDTALKLNRPYVTAFCSTAPKLTPDDGLLSQWRGYGTDGGYAIVFDTSELQQLLDKEWGSFYYQFSAWGDVEYYDQDTSHMAAHQKTLELEKVVQQATQKFILTNKPEELDGLAEPMTMLSCMHKHRGFVEEAEVRIVVLPANAELFELSQKNSDKRPKKSVEFVMKDGILIPYIKLFGDQSNGSLTKLPISKIIVGPHTDRVKRKKAVELLLEQHEIKAEVTMSDIPYLGR